MNENKTQPKRWISPAEFEEEFGVCKSTQAKWRMNKKIPYSKFSKIIRYDRERIHELFESCNHDMAG